MTVLDTSAIIAALERGESPARRAVLGLLADAADGIGEPPVVSVLTVAEILRGTAFRPEVEERYAAVLAACAVHEVTESQARAAASLGAAADARGLPARERPGLVDAAIGALSIELDAELLTRDAHFRALPGLQLAILPEGDA